MKLFLYLSKVVLVGLAALALQSCGATAPHKAHHAPHGGEAIDSIGGASAAPC